MISEIMNKVSFDARNPGADGYIERILLEDLPRFPDHLARYAFALHWVPGRTVVDLCCGTGYGSRMLTAGGATSVLGVDIDPKAVELAERKQVLPGLSFRCADVTSPIGFESVDLAICFEGLEHVTAPKKLVANIAGHLAPNGIALISTPNAGYFSGGHSGNPYHVQEYKLEDFHSLLRPHFRSIRMFFQWGLSDPHDRSWSFRSLARLLIPVSLKRALRFMVRARSTSRDQSESILQANPLLWRPYPVTYLSSPGLRGAQPYVWIALCQGPIVGSYGDA